MVLGYFAASAAFCQWWQLLFHLGQVGLESFRPFLISEIILKLSFVFTHVIFV